MFSKAIYIYTFVRYMLVHNIIMNHLPWIIWFFLHIFPPLKIFKWHSVWHENQIHFAFDTINSISLSPKLKLTKYRQKCTNENFTVCGDCSYLTTIYSNTALNLRCESFDFSLSLAPFLVLNLCLIQYGCTNNTSFNCKLIIAHYLSKL